MKIPVYTEELKALVAQHKSLRNDLTQTFDPAARGILWDMAAKAEREIYAAAIREGFTERGVASLMGGDG